MILDSPEQQPVLILGAGINGTAVARELALNGMAVWVVDSNDVAYGATAKSSRLIHGGLRYLEYGDFGLVRESLRERNRLCRLAPQFVRPLRLYIPVAHRAGGLIRSAFRFLGSSRWRFLGWLDELFSSAKPRGLWVVRLGLRFYDLLAGNDDFPRSRVHCTAEASVPHVDATTYRWLCAFTDAQIPFAERFVVAQLHDARRIADHKGLSFRVLTHCRAELQGRTVEIRRTIDGKSIERLKPAAVVNATGAWGDFTLSELHVPSRPLFGGTKGSHIVTHRAELREAIGEDGIYAEASDGRLIFVLPFGSSVLIGTTDEDFDDRPDRAVATDRELDYLLGMVNELFPEVGLTDDDVHLHYSGVRPLPSASGALNSAISRDHWIQEHPDAELPLFTLVGGKLTTCRAFAEQVADTLLEILGVPRTADSSDRPYPGAEGFPQDAATQQTFLQQLAADTGYSLEQVQSVWSLCGTQAREVLASQAEGEPKSLTGTDVPVAMACWAIEREWAETLGDLVERRLMLIYQPVLSEQCLRELAGLLVASGKLDASQRDAAVCEAIERLARHYGKQPSRPGAAATARDESSAAAH